MSLATLLLLAALSAEAEVESIDTLSLEWAAATDSLRLVRTDSVATPASKDSAREARFVDGAPGSGAAIEGIVRDEDGRALPRAVVLPVGGGVSTRTDEQGRFRLEGLAAGRISLLVTRPGFEPRTLADLETKSDRIRLVEAVLATRALQGERVTITAKASRKSEAGLLFARRRSPAVSDGVSAEQIAKSPDGDAGAAIRRVTGISVGGDGLVYVRGMGERYVNVQLNGITLSSPDPEKRVIPMDAFPTRLLEGLSVSKSFTADQPGEFAGGSVQINTRTAPEDAIFEVSTGVGWSEGTTGRNLLTYRGGKHDIWGFDDGTRDVPDAIPDTRFSHSTTTLGKTRPERKIAQQAMIDALPNVFTPYEERAPLNHSWGATAGMKHALPWDVSLGWLAGGSFSGSWDRSDEFRQKVGADETGKVSVIDTWTRRKSTQSVLSGALGTVSLSRDFHNVSYTGLATRTWDDAVGEIKGVRADPDTAITWELMNQSQTLLNGQIRGDHRLEEDGPRWTWVLAKSAAHRDEPDQRLSKLVRTEFEDPETGEISHHYVPDITNGTQDRFWYALREEGHTARTTLDLPVPWVVEEGSIVQAGLFGQAKNRTFDARRISYYPNLSRIPDSILINGGHEGAWEYLDGSTDSGYIENLRETRKNDYAVRDVQSAWWLHSDLKWTPWLRTVAGARFSENEVRGSARDAEAALDPSERAVAECDDSGECVIRFGYAESNVLPAVSAILTPAAQHNLRLGWTRTMAFPEYREMAPLLVELVLEGIEQTGNPSLEPTKIENWDARWEWYPGVTEMVAVSGFWKDFEDPVEARLNQVGSNLRAFYQNAPSAWAGGIELEGRAGLGRIHPWLAPIQVQSNWTGIRSRVRGERSRTLQGQAPWLFNAMVYVDFLDGRIQSSLLYNRIGRRLGRISMSLFPDVYDEERESLDAALTLKPWKALKWRLAGKNLLDAPQESTQGGIVVRRVEPGRSWSTSVSYAF